MFHTDLSSVLAKKPFNRDESIARYKRLIRTLPDDNRYLLLYVLDLLSVFARKSDKNLMTAKSTPARSTCCPHINRYVRLGGDLPSCPAISSKPRVVTTRAPAKPRRLGVPNRTPRLVHAGHCITFDSDVWRSPCRARGYDDRRQRLDGRGWTESGATTNDVRTTKW